MKYYSEVTKHLYDTQKELDQAEAKVAETKAAEERKSKERATRAKEVQEAYKAILEAQKKYTELRNAFVKDYGSYHMTYSTTEQVKDIDSLMDALFNLM